MKTWLAIAAINVAWAAPVTDFRAKGMTGETAVFETAKAKATVVVFYSVLCPISNEFNDRMSLLYKTYKSKDVQFVFADANDNESAAEIARHAKLAQYPFPVYRDEHNRIADLLKAEATPESFVLDSAGEIRYRGFIEDSKNEARVKVHGLSDAIDAVLSGKPVLRPETKSFGCTIKRHRKTS